MNIQHVALFLHVVGAVGLFFSLGIEWAIFMGLTKAASGARVLESLAAFSINRKLGPPSLLLTLIPGFYLASFGFGHSAWVAMSLGALVAIAVLGATVTGRRLAALRDAVQGTPGTLSDDTLQKLRDRGLALSLLLRTGLLLAVVFLMTVKPTPLVAAIGVGLFVATAIALGSRYRPPAATNVGA